MARTTRPAPRREPSAEQYQMAWRRLRAHRGCPDTPEAAAAHRLWGIALRALALDLGRVLPFDRKRAAANDKD